MPDGARDSKIEFSFSGNPEASGFFISPEGEFE
jgi:hypothetical protein